MNARKSSAKPSKPGAKSGAKATTKSRSKAGASGEEEKRSTRDIWKGAVTFGLVEIPIALVSAEKPGGLALSHLDKRDFAPVGYRRYNKVTDEDVTWDDIVQGYQHRKGEYVVLGKNDLAQANPTLTQTIGIEQFVDASDIELIYFEKPYYLEPLKAHSKSYALLRETLRRTKKVGVARFALRTKEHLGIVGVRDNALVLYLLRYADEVRAPSALENLEGESPAVSAKEIEMAERLVADMTGEWDPSVYRDEYVDDVMKVIERKIASGDVHTLDDGEAPTRKRASGEVLDLMPLLRKSVEEAAGRRTSPPKLRRVEGAKPPASGGPAKSPRGRRSA